MNTEKIGFVRVIHKVSGWAGGLGTVFLFIITITVICDAFARSFFNLPLRFGPDLLSFLAIFSILLPSAMALRNDRHIEVDVIFNKLPKSLKSPIRVITFSIALIVFTITTIYAFQLTMDSVRGSLKSNSPFGMKLWYSQLGVFIGMGLLSLQILAKIILEIFYKEQKGLG